MASKQFNSVDGYSVGSVATTVVDANSNISGNAITATANVTSPRFISNVATGTAPFVVNSTTQVANLNAATAGTAGTVTTAAQPNITSVGTLTSLGVNGTITGVNITANTGVFSGNGSSLTALNASNISTGTLAQARLANSTLTLGNTTLTLGATTTTVTGLSSVTSTTFVGALTGAATTAGTVTTAAQPNITSVGTLTSLTANGNVAFNMAAANTVAIAATAAQTSDMVTIVGNTSTAGVNALYVGFTGLSAAVEASAMRIDLTPGGTSGGTWTGLRLTQGAATASGVNVNVIKADSITAGAGTDNVLYIGTGYDNIINYNGTSVIYGNGKVNGSEVVGTVPSATSATTAGTVTTAAQPNITSVGTLTSLAVSGNATAANIGVTGNVTAANITANTGIFSGNGSGLTALNASNLSSGTVPSARLSGSYSISVTGSAGTAGTVTTAAQPNITSVGTLSSLSVTGNVAAGNLTTTGVLSVTGTGQSSIAGNLDMTSNNIVNLATPVNPTDAATKQYVDDIAQGLHTHDSCNAATSTTLAVASGGTVTYNNGSSGVGATLTTTGSYTTIDGVTLSNGMRILVKNEANAAHNGIYDRTSTTVLTRSSDFDTSTEMAGGDFTFVTAGTLYDNTGWVMTDPVTTVGTTDVNWIQFSGAGTYTAGTGLTLTGSQFSVNASQTQITSVGTLTGLNSSGTITAPAFTANTGVFTGNGSGLSAIAGANVTGTVANATYATSAGSATSATTATTAGTVTTAAQPNITSVGTLTGLTANGNVRINQNAAEIFTVAARQAPTSDMVSITNSGQAITTAGVNLLNLTFVGGAAAVESSAYRTDFTPGSTSGGTWNGYRMVASAGAASGVTMNAFKVDNITGGAGTENMFYAGTGWDNILNYNGTSVIYGNGTVNGSQVVGTVPSATSATSATTAGTVTTAAQPNITSVGTLTSLGVNGTITGVNITANTGVFTGSGSGLTTLNASNISSGTLAQARLANASVTLGSTALTLGSTVTTVAGLSSVTSTTFVGALTGAATTAGTVTTAAQPNITSVGTLTSLTVSGNANVGNIGATNFVGSGASLTNLNASNLASGTVPSARLSGTYTITVSGSATTAGTVTTAAQPNITSTGTLTSLTVSGNANFDSGTLFVDSVNNEVGIGTTTPSANLDVIGNTRIQSNIAYVSPNGANTINSQMLNGGTLAWSGNAGQLFSITDSMTGNIFAVNDVSGIPMISVDAGGNIQFAASGGFVSFGVTTGITAAGSTQGTATSLTRPINVVSTVSASTGVILPTVPAGARIVVMNTSGTALNVYPPSGAAINSGSTNAAYSMPAGTRLEFISVSTTQWYTLNATYG